MRFSNLRPARTWWLRIGKALLGVGSILLLCAIATLLFILDAEPRHRNPAALDAATVQRASTFIKRVSQQVLNGQATTTLAADATEINGALALAERSYPHFSGHVSLHDGHMQLFASWRLSLLGWSRSLNLRGTVADSPQGLHWRELALGRLQVGPDAANALFQRSVYLLLGKRYGRSLLGQIGAVNTTPARLNLVFTPPDDFRSGMANAARRLSHYVGHSVALDTARVQHYLDFLVTMTRALPQQDVSLAHYLNALLLEAQKQSLQHDPALENLHATYALALQTAPGAFKHFVRDIGLRRLNATYQPQFTLAARHDLAQHFIISAGIKILTDRGVSFSIGETKEIIDAGQGGSGFSFADIAADRAGIAFIEAATANADTARLVQSFASSTLREDDIFPRLDTLPEGLSRDEFDARYHGVDSPAYAAALADIDQRLARCAILGLAPTAAP